MANNSARVETLSALPSFLWCNPVSAPRSTAGKAPADPQAGKGQKMSIRILETPKNLLLDKLNLQALSRKHAGMCRCGSRPCTCGRLPDGLNRWTQGAMEHQVPLYQPGMYVKPN